MPYGIKALPPLLFFSFIIWFISLFTPVKYKNFNYKKWILYILPAYAIISLLSLTYSEDIFTGKKILERLISFMVLPFLFFTSKDRLNLKNDIIFLLLGASLSIAIVALIFHFQNIIDIEKLAKLSTPGDVILHIRYYIAIHELTIHSSYFSYLILVYLIYGYFFLKKSINFRFFHLILIPLSTITLFLLQSRAALVSLFFLLVFLISKLLFQKRYLLFSIALILILSAGTLAYNYTRLGTTIQNTISSKDKTQTDPRITIWKNSLNSIKESPIVGHGIGDALNELIKEHKRTGFTLGAESRFDAHNQFLETWLQSGLFGLISLLLIFAIPLYQSIKKKQELLFLFLMVSFIQLLFESMFLRLAGVVYFSFFYSYLYYVYYAKGGEWEQEKGISKPTTSNSPNTN